MADYALYGLVIRCDLPLAGLEAAPAGLGVDVNVELGAPPVDTTHWNRVTHYVGPAESGDRPAVVVRSDPALGFWFHYDDGNEFVIDRAATAIRGWWTDGSSLADSVTYLLGPILGFALRLRGVLAFHASAVLLNGRAVAMLGPSGSGKSTTAAAFAAAGAPVLADDVVAVRLVDGVALAYPSYRLLRLWDESERILFGTVGQLPRMTSTWDKRALPLGGEHPFHDQPAPLGDLFVLAPRSDDPRAPFVETMGAGEAFVEVVANTYANYLLDDAMRGDEMRALAAVLRGRVVRRLAPHASPARLGDLVGVVRAAVADANQG